MLSAGFGAVCAKKVIGEGGGKGEKKKNPPKTHTSLVRERKGGKKKKEKEKQQQQTPPRTAQQNKLLSLLRRGWEKSECAWEGGRAGGSPPARGAASPPHPRAAPGPARPGAALSAPPPRPPRRAVPSRRSPFGHCLFKAGQPRPLRPPFPPSCPAPPSGAAAAALPARLKRQRPRGRGSPPGRGGAAPPRGLTGSPRGRPPPALPGRIPRPGPAVRCASGPRRSPLFIRRRCRSPRCPQPGAPSRPPRSGGYGEREPRHARPDGCSRRSGSRRVTRAVPVIASLWLLITIFNEMQLFLFFFFPGQFRHYPVWCRGTTAPLASAS